MELKLNVGREQVFQAWESLEVDRRKWVIGLEIKFFPFVGKKKKIVTWKLSILEGSDWHFFNIWGFSYISGF